MPGMDMDGAAGEPAANHTEPTTLDRSSGSAVGSTELEVESFEPRNWSHLLGSHTPQTVSISLPSTLLDALLRGSLTTPDVSVPEPLDDTWHDGTPVEGDDEDGALEEDSAATVSPEAAASLRETSAAVDDAIRQLGGVVVPKLGRVAPSDATWVTFTRSLRCERASDVFTLVGASERVMKECDGVAPLWLCLRACIPDVDSMMEFRVFVRGGRIVGLSQRDTQAPSSLGQRDMDRVIDAVSALFDDTIASALTDYSPHTDSGYTFDVFVDRSWTIWVLDVAPWGEGATDALLFSWEELEAAEWMDGDPDGDEESNRIGTGRPQLRCVSAQSGIRPAQTMYDAMPVELRGAGSAEALAAAARRITELQNRNQGAGDSSESETERCAG